MTRRHPIALEYHDVVAPNDFDASGFPGKAAASYKLPIPRFAEHVALLAALPLRRAANGDDSLQQLAPRGVVLTFDDGGVSAIEHIAPLLEGGALRGAFFVTTGRIDTPGFLSSAQIVELHRRGHVIGSHSHSHPTRMSACSANELAREWGESVAHLASLVQEPVTTASVPGGYYSRAVGEAAAAAGIRLLFTSEPSSRVTRCGSCVVLGRYTLRREDPARRVAALVGASSGARRVEWLKWNGKKVAKVLGGRAYLRLRDVMFRES